MQQAFAQRLEATLRQLGLSLNRRAQCHAAEICPDLGSVCEAAAKPPLLFVGTNKAKPLAYHHGPLGSRSLISDPEVVLSYLKASGTLTGGRGAMPTTAFSLSKHLSAGSLVTTAVWATMHRPTELPNVTLSYICSI